MKVVGLTGGIATGKTTVSHLLLEAGVPVIDADVVARQVVEPQTLGWQRLKAQFGPEIIQPGGTLDRKKLGSLVFADSKKLMQLNAIMQPLVRQQMTTLIDAYRNKNTNILILDIPLLYEQGYDSYCDQVVVVATSKKVQLMRLMDRNHYSKQQAIARIDAQMSLAAKIKRADLIIDNDGSLANTRRQVVQILTKLQS